MVHSQDCFWLQSLRARQGDVSETMSEASIEASSRIGGADYAPAPGRARTSSYASEVEVDPHQPLASMIFADMA